MNLTVIIVHYKTPKLLERAISSIPADISLIVVENGNTLHLMQRKKTDKVLNPPTQMFHGDGLHFGIKHIKTPYFVCMDSDACIEDPQIFGIMIKMMTPHTYGVGNVIVVNKKGINDWHKDFEPPGFPYLHPHFCMIETQKYHECEPFVHHGAPALYIMQDIQQKEYIVKHIPNLSKYVSHESRGTRKVTNEYLSGWDIRY